jgi:hypothetical protein
MVQLNNITVARWAGRRAYHTGVTNPYEPCTVESEDFISGWHDADEAQAKFEENDDVQK